MWEEGSVPERGMSSAWKFIIAQEVPICKLNISLPHMVLVSSSSSPGWPTRHHHNRRRRRHPVDLPEGPSSVSQCLALVYSRRPVLSSPS